MTYFNAGKLPESERGYVAWVDIMGTRNSMISSLSKTSNFIFKLHSSAIESKSNATKKYGDELFLYNVMDGCYVFSKKNETILNFIFNLFYDMSKTFINEKKDSHKFLIRSSISFGGVIRGCNVPEDAFGRQKYEGRIEQINKMKNGIIMGMPIIQAYENEKKAPPYGIYIHESARESIRKTWFRWWEKATTEDINFPSKLKNSITSHFDWLSNNYLESGYPKDSMENHKLMVNQYFFGIDEKIIEE
jgi:hypothetical protein